MLAAEQHILPQNAQGRIHNSPEHFAQASLLDPNFFRQPLATAAATSCWMFCLKRRVHVVLFRHVLLLCSFRYGERNNLTFALPKQPAAHVFNYNIKFNPTMVRPSPTGDYNILCNHLHFAESGVREIMPENTKFVAIVRNPGTWSLKQKKNVKS